MALLLQEPSGLAPNRDRRDTPPRRVLQLVVVVVVVILSEKKNCSSYIKSIGEPYAKQDTKFQKRSIRPNACVYKNIEKAYSLRVKKIYKISLQCQ